MKSTWLDPANWFPPTTRRVEIKEILIENTLNGALLEWMQTLRSYDKVPVLRVTLYYKGTRGLKFLTGALLKAMS